MTKYYSIDDAVKSFNDSDIPIFIPVFEQLSYAKYMVSQLTGLGISNFILCDNGSSYEPMIDYLNNTSKDHRVLYLNNNYGPRIYSEVKEVLDKMPEWFIVTDPDLIFNKNLPSTFIEDMVEVSAYYQFPKVGFALEIFEKEASEKFFNKEQIHRWEARYWDQQIGSMKDNSPIYFAPNDTTFAVHNKGMLQSEVFEKGGTALVRSARIAGNYTCEHMGWWKEQPLTPEEYHYYKLVQTWGSTENEKRKMGL
jgi:hypothetical protein